MEDAKLIRVLKALAHPQRFKMIQEIAAAGELSCGEVQDVCPMSQPTASHHLRILLEAGLLVQRQDGNHRFTSVNRALLAEVSTLLPQRAAGAAGRSPDAPPRRRSKTG